jgi:hypothetical protein
MMARMALPPRVNPIGRPSKGDRAEIMCRALLPVYEEIRRRAADRGMSISQYTADVLAQHVGRDDLVRELDREVLPTTA